MLQLLWVCFGRQAMGNRSILKGVNNANRSSNPRLLKPAVLGVVILLALSSGGVVHAEPYPKHPQLELTPNDVVAFLGGGNTAHAARGAFVEALLTAVTKGGTPRFRNLAWEGDTILRRDRPLNFGDETRHLRQIGATVVFVDFGRTEAIERVSVIEFQTAYERLLKALASVASIRKIVLTTPAPFQKASTRLPDLSIYNPHLSALAQIIKKLATRRRAVLVDVHKLFETHLQASRNSAETELSQDGVTYSRAGQELVATLTLKGLGYLPPKWSQVEPIREALAKKNELWRNYYRPTNWSFLYGDRTSVASSYDHLDPTKRWFPGEVAEYAPLIAAAEARVAALQSNASAGGDSAHQKTQPSMPKARLEPPSVEQATMIPAEGFSVSLFASELQGIANPVQIRWDERGRLYVLCTWIYPQIKPGENPNDKIFILEDVNGDGEADRSTLFADGLDAPLGIELGDGGVYVGQGIDLLHIRDTDGDDKADERRVVLSGFGTGDTHHTISNFVWSPEGDLNMLQGFHINSNIETPHGIRRLDTAGIWRFRPKELDLRGYIGHELAPHNPWGLSYDEWGRAVLVAGNGHGIYDIAPFMIDSARGIAVRSKGGTTKFAGVEFLDGRHLPPEIHGQIVTGAFLFNAVARFGVDWEGSSFRLKELPPLLRSTHKSFRPVDVKMGPDGALYVADFFDPIITHYGASLRHPDRDKLHGRIWRVTARNRPLVPRTKLAGLSTGGLIEQLGASERWTRYQARRLLRDTEPDAVAAKLDDWVARLDHNQPDFERRLVEAGGIFASINRPRPQLLAQLSSARDSRARAFAARLLARWQRSVAEPLKTLGALVTDPDARVRVEAIVAAASIPSSNAVEVAARALDLPHDEFIESALARTVSATKPFWKQALARGLLTFDGKLDRLAFVMAADGTRDALKNLQALVRKHKMNRDLHQRVLQTLVDVGGAAEWRLALLPTTFVRDGGYDAELHAITLQRLVAIAPVRPEIVPADVKDLLRTLLSRPHIDIRIAAIRLSAAFKQNELAEDIHQIAMAKNTPMLVRTTAIACLRDLARTPSEEWLIKLAEPQESPEIRVAAAVAIARFDRPRAATIAASLLSGIQTFDPGPLLAGFLNRKGATIDLARSLRETPPTPDLAKLSHRALTSSGYNEPELLEVLSEALGLQSSAPKYDIETVRSLALDSEKRGNADRGEILFWSNMTNCVACHAIGGAGGFLGPDLSGVGTGLAIEQIVEAVLWPARQVKEGFLSVTVATKDDRILQGYKVNEDADKIVLRDAATSELTTLPRRDITSSEEAGTLMPEGLTATLTRNELLDLIRFLSDLGRTGPRRITDEQVSRRWRISSLPDTAQSWREAPAQLPGDFPGADGVPAYSQTSGVLLASAMEQATQSNRTIAYSELDVMRAGDFTMTVSEAKHCWYFVDGILVKPGARFPLAAGRHALSAIVDLKQISNGGIRVGWNPAPGASSELKTVGGL
jgi:putative heme-binding domain-containing protein